MEKCELNIKQREYEDCMTYYCVLWNVVHCSERGANQSSILDKLDQLGARNERFGGHNHARKLPMPCKVHCFLQIAGPDVTCRKKVGLVEKHYGIRPLFMREEYAKLGAERSEDDGPISGKPVDLFEDGVDHNVEFNTVKVHLPVLRLPEHWVLSKSCVRGNGFCQFQECTY
jgi:hypothetical protein